MYKGVQLGRRQLIPSLKQIHSNSNGPCKFMSTTLISKGECKMAQISVNEYMHTSDTGLPIYQVDS